MKKYCLWIFALILCYSNVHAQNIFSDAFDNSAKPEWGNESGSWVVSDGVYSASKPNNNPIAYTSLTKLPRLKDFIFEADIINAQDGGIFLRSVKCKNNNMSGVLLVIHGIGNQLWWHKVTCDSVGSVYNSVSVADIKGNNIHIKIVVKGNSFSAYLNNSEKPITQFKTDKFKYGGIALYSNSTQSFDNIQIYQNAASKKRGGTK